MYFSDTRAGSSLVKQFVWLNPQISYHQTIDVAVVSLLFTKADKWYLLRVGQSTGVQPIADRTLDHQSTK
jgi:hypothetical protein